VESYSRGARPSSEVEVRPRAVRPSSEVEVCSRVDGAVVRWAAVAVGPQQVVGLVRVSVAVDFVSSYSDSCFKTTSFPVVCRPFATSCSKFFAFLCILYLELVLDLDLLPLRSTLSTRGNKQRLPKMMFAIQPSSDLIHIYGNFDLLPIFLK
jgi:hypothetical protein